MPLDDKVDFEHNRSEILEPEVLPAKTAYHKELKRSFPYYDERDDAILVKRLTTEELIWSPKYLWDFTTDAERALHHVTTPAAEALLKVRVRDRDRFWTFKITESEFEALEQKHLTLYWCQGWRHVDEERQAEQALIEEWYGPRLRSSKRSSRKEAETPTEAKLGQLQQLINEGASLQTIRRKEQQFKKRLKKIQRKAATARVHREWCLVTRAQRELLLSGVNYDEEAQRLFNEGGSSAWSEWSSIRWAKSQTWREYRRIKRTPIRSFHT